MRRHPRARPLAAVSSGTFLLLAACGPVPAGPPAPAHHVDTAAFGPLTGPDSLVVSDSSAYATRQVYNGVMPRYPVEMLRAGRVGSVVVSYVVDTTGRVTPGTIAVLRSDDPRLTSVICAVMPRLKYRPELRDGRLRRVLAVQAFVFTTEGSSYTGPDTAPLQAAMRAVTPAEAVRVLGTVPACS